MVGACRPGAPRVAFRLSRDGSISAAGQRAAAVTRCGTGWLWEVGGPCGGACGASGSLGTALDAAAVAHSGRARWLLTLPAGDILLVRPGTAVCSALAERGFSPVVGVTAFLAFEMPPGASPAQAGARLELLLTPGEAAKVGTVSQFDGDGCASHWCADLDLAVGGYIEADRLVDLAADWLSPGAAALLIGAEPRFGPRSRAGAAPEALLA